MDHVLNWMHGNKYKSYMRIHIWIMICNRTENFRDVISNHRSFYCLFNSLCRSTSKKHQSPHYWPFVQGIRRWPANSLNKGPVTGKKLPFDDVIMNNDNRTFLSKHRSQWIKQMHNSIAGIHCANNAICWNGWTYFGDQNLSYRYLKSVDGWWSQNRRTPASSWATHMYAELCAKSRYLWQGQVITSHRYFGM